jgi:hypothetical protein
MLDRILHHSDHHQHQRRDLQLAEFAAVPSALFGEDNFCTAAAASLPHYRFHR